MNPQELSALADTTFNLSQGPLKEFKARHQALLREKGLMAQGEAYKFTGLERFFGEFSREASLHSIPESEEGAFVFVDGKLISSPALPGIKASSLSPEDLTQVLSGNAPLSHLHHSFMGPGLLLEVEKNVELKAAVRVLHIIGLDEVAAPTLIIKMAPNSKMTLIEETKSSKASYVQVAESYAYLSEGAKLEHLQVDQGRTSSLNHGSTWAHVGQDASYTNFIFHLNGKLQRRNLDIKLNAPGANGESYSLFLTAGTEHSDVSTVIGHLAADTTSGQIAKGILGDESKGVFTGKIHIHPKAQGVVSGQLNRNLLLSKKAQVHSQPQLEIFADDVKCSHGSTTGQMSEEEVFYFEARGIPADKARTLLAFGFGLEIVLKIRDKDTRTHVEQLVLKALREKFNLGGAP